MHELLSTVVANRYSYDPAFKRRVDKLIETLDEGAASEIDLAAALELAIDMHIRKKSREISAREP